MKKEKATEAGMKQDGSREEKAEREKRKRGEMQAGKKLSKTSETIGCPFTPRSPDDRTPRT